MLENYKPLIRTSKKLPKTCLPEVFVKIKKTSDFENISKLLVVTHLC